MNSMKQIITGVIVLGAIALGVWWYSSSQQVMEDKPMMNKEAAMKQPDTMAKKDDSASEKRTETTMKQDDGMMMKGGQYVSYDASKIAFAQNGKVVLFFRASWCPSCRALDADIKTNVSQIPSNVLILDVDYDKYTDLKKQYGVTYQHTLVQVDAAGNMLAKWSGSTGLSDLIKQVK